MATKWKTSLLSILILAILGVLTFHQTQLLNTSDPENNNHSHRTLQKGGGKGGGKKTSAPTPVGGGDGGGSGGGGGGKGGGKGNNKTPRPTPAPTSSPTESPTESSVSPSAQPSVLSSPPPSSEPSAELSNKPSVEPSIKTTSPPSVDLSSTPSTAPSTNPTPRPTPAPTSSPTESPTKSPAPSDGTSDVTYYPGILLDDTTNGISLSQGLQARLIGRTGQRAQYADGSISSRSVHDQPDSGACFDLPDGGWVYVSNAEKGGSLDPAGGVGAFRFNQAGGLIDYKMVLTNSRRNCGGGVTPWGTFFSGEEVTGGYVYEVDPLGGRSERTSFGTGKFESATCDSRVMSSLKCFATIDRSTGELRRLTPNPTVLSNAIASGDYSNVLTATGTLHYLVLNSSNGTFRWTTDKAAAQSSASSIYPNAEGIDAHDGILYFVSKARKMLFILDLDAGTYTEHSTVSGSFASQPDQVIHLIGDDPNSNAHLYFLEDGGDRCGVFARDLQNNRFFTILEKIADGSSGEETTGLAFCDNHRRMIFAFQDSGRIFEVTRDDGLPFYGATVNVKYHDSAMQSKRLSNDEEECGAEKLIEKILSRP